MFIWYLIKKWFLNCVIQYHWPELFNSSSYLHWDWFASFIFHRGRRSGWIQRPMCRCHQSSLMSSLVLALTARSILIPGSMENWNYLFIGVYYCLTGISMGALRLKIPKLSTAEWEAFMQHGMCFIFSSNSVTSGAISAIRMNVITL